MPRNPFANPLFVPVFLRVMLLILVGLAAVLLSQRRSLKVWRRSTLFLRARTWFVIGPLFVVAVFAGGFVAFLLATFVVVQGCSEFARIAGIERRYAYLLIVGGELGLLDVRQGVQRRRGGNVRTIDDALEVSGGSRTIAHSQFYGGSPSCRASGNI